nr:5,6-dimethylbenzimidazole synthase [Gammaproteobacteria bacterium]
MITPRGYGHKYHDVTGEAKRGEKPGRSLSLGLVGWQAAVHRYLSEKPAASIGSAARKLDIPLGEVLEAIAERESDAGPPASRYRATPVGAAQLSEVLEALRHWGWLRAVVDTEAGTRAELLLRGDDLKQVGDQLQVLHERFTLHIPWRKVAAVWLVSGSDTGYGACFLDDRKEPVCAFWLAIDTGKIDARALVHFLDTRDRLGEPEECRRTQTGAPQPLVETEQAKDTDFSVEARDTLYRIMRARRDMRHFRPAARVEPAALQRILQAAQMAPSVGLMQPWRLIRIRDRALRAATAALVDRERERTAEAFGKRGAEFLQLKVEGIHDCAELLAVVQAPDDGTLLGRRTLPLEMALCSTACAIQNMWLAARAENLGLGWVSFFDPVELATLLKCPQGAKPIALLCLGPVHEFYARPMLEEVGWRQARPLENSIFEDRWTDESMAGARTPGAEPPG